MKKLLKRRDPTRPRKREHALLTDGLLLLFCGLFAGLVVAAAAFPAVAMSGLAAKAGSDTFDNLPADFSVLPSPQITYVYDSTGSTRIATLYDENRLDADDAAGPADDRVLGEDAAGGRRRDRADPVAQDPRDEVRDRAGEEVHQAADPRAVPEHLALRPRRLRRVRRRARELQQGPQGPAHRRIGARRRPVDVAEPLRPGHREGPAPGPRADEVRAQANGRDGHDHRRPAGRGGALQ